MRKRAMQALRGLTATALLLAATAGGAFAQQQAPKELPVNRVEGLIAEWTRAKDYTKEYIDAMPENGLGFKPTPEVRSFAEQMLHLAGGNYFFVNNVFGVPEPAAAKDLEKREDLKKDRAALNKAVADSYDFVIAQLRGVKAAQLDAPITMFKMKMPLNTALLKAFEHQSHHRGQTTIYIRLKGVKPPNERLF